MWLWLWDSGIVLDSQQNCGGPPLLEMYQSRMISVIKLRLWVMPALFFLSLDSWQTFLRTYLLSFQEAVLMQTQWGCYWRDGCRKCPDLADYSSFWTEKKKNLCFSASLCSAFFNLRRVMELWTWLQRRSLKSKTYNCVCILGRRKKNTWRTPDPTGDNSTRKGYEEQAKSLQEMEKRG